MAKRVDANQTIIVFGLRQFGASVAVTSDLGHGFPDLVCAYHGKTYLMEIKSEHGKLTPDEQKFHDEWRGIIYTVRTIEQALQILCDDCEE